MDILGLILTIFVGLTALVSASGKLTKQAAIVEILDHVKVDDPIRSLLPFLQIAGGLGALVSLAAVPLLGVAALAGLALYYAGAVVYHLRVGDAIGQYAVPLGLALVSAAAAAVRLLTL